MCIRDSSDTCVTEAEVVGEVSAESDIMLKATVKNNGTVAVSYTHLPDPAAVYFSMRFLSSGKI